MKRFTIIYSISFYLFHGVYTYIVKHVLFSIHFLQNSLISNQMITYYMHFIIRSREFYVIFYKRKDYNVLIPSKRLND